ncbi:MAG: sugar phosphate isomerase/epimerase family protein, partial [Nitrososphaerales archaeon]
MQMAFDTTVLRSLSMENALKEISNAGYDFIEIGLAHFSHVDPSDEEVVALKRALSENDLKIAALCRVYPVSYPEEEVRAAGVQRFR